MDQFRARLTVGDAKEAKKRVCLRQATVDVRLAVRGKKMSVKV